LSKLRKNIIVFLASNGAARAVLLLSTPLLTRLYTPELYGVSGIVVTLIGIISGIASLRYDRAIVLANERSKAESLTGLTLVLCSMTSLVVLMVVVYWLDLFSNILNIPPAYSAIMLLVPFGVLLSGFFNAFSGWAQWGNNFKRLGIATIAESILSAATKVLLSLFWTANPIFLVVGSLIGSLVGLVIAAKSFNFPHRVFLRDRNSIFGLSREYIDFPMYNLPVEFISRVGQQFPVLLLPVLFSPKVGGLYVLASTTLHLPVTLFANSVRKVLLKEMVDRKRKGIVLIPLVKKYTFLMVLIGFLPFGIMYFYSEVFFAMIFGNDWVVAGKYARYMLPLLFLMFVDSAIMDLYVVHRLQKILLKLQTILFFVKLVAMVVSFSIFKTVDGTLIVYFGVSFVGRFALTSTALLLNSRFYSEIQLSSSN